MKEGRSCLPSWRKQVLACHGHATGQLLCMASSEARPDGCQGKQLLTKGCPGPCWLHINCARISSWITFFFNPLTSRGDSLASPTPFPSDSGTWPEQPTKEVQSQGLGPSGRSLGANGHSAHPQSCTSCVTLALVWSPSPFHSCGTQVMLGGVIVRNSLLEKPAIGGASATALRPVKIHL